MGAFEESSVPFQLAGRAQPLILLPASVNGYGPFPFILDTGAGFNLITTRLAAEAAIAPFDERRGVGAGGAVTLSLGVARTLCVGKISLRNTRVGITDELLRVGAAIGANIEGAVGYEFLQDFCLTLDYRHQIATFSSGGEKNADGQRRRINFRLAKPEKPLVLVDAFVNERGPLQFALDTGASTTTLSRALASTLELRTIPIPAMTGGGGAIEAETARVESLRVGESRVGYLDVVVTSATDFVSRAIGEPLDGILGYNFLSNFDVAIDYPRSFLTLS